jgi:hypothetical protein
VPPLRRGDRELRRRRRNRLLAWLGRLTPPLALVALPGTMAAWLLTSPRFALAQVEVTTGGRISPTWVRRTLEPLAGRNLVRLPLGEVERLLASHPWVAGLEIHKALPDRLEVTVRERQPAALIVRGEELWYADAEGNLVAPAGEGDHRELPWIRQQETETAAGSRRVAGVPGALNALGELAAHQPAWAAGLVEIRVLGEEDFAVETTALPFPLLVRPGDVAAKAAWLEELLPEILRRYQRLEAIDLRFSRRIVLKMPAGTVPAGEIYPSPSAGESAEREREVRSHG